MSRIGKTRVMNRVILPIFLDLFWWAAAANSPAPLNSASTNAQSRVTFSQQPPTASESARPPRGSFCSEEYWDYYLDNYANGVAIFGVVGAGLGAAAI